MQYSQSKQETVLFSIIFSFSLANEKFDHALNHSIDGIRRSFKDVKDNRKIPEKTDKKWTIPRDFLQTCIFFSYLNALRLRMSKKPCNHRWIHRIQDKKKWLKVEWSRLLVFISIERDFSNHRRYWKYTIINYVRKKLIVSKTAIVIAAWYDRVFIVRSAALADCLMSILSCSHDDLIDYSMRMRQAVRLVQLIKILSYHCCASWRVRNGGGRDMRSVVPDCLVLSRDARVKAYGTRVINNSRPRARLEKSDTKWKKNAFECKPSSRNGS